MEGNVEKAVTLAAFVENSLRIDSLALMEPDTIALNHLLMTGKEKLGREVLEQTLMNGRALQLEEIIAQELPQ